MKIVQINTFPYKATGSIMMNIHNKLLEMGEESYVVWGRGREAENEHEITILDNIGVKFHGIYTRLTDKTGFASKRATKYLLRTLDEIQPDIIHLHNIHGYYVNIEMLFQYIRKNNIKVVWTLHDCWAFTGHCAYFDMVGCEKWKTGCYDCEQKKTYPVSLLKDNSKWNWEKKRKLFTELDVTIVTPSKWLAGLVKTSFLKDYPVYIIHNGINFNIFKPNLSYELKEKYGIDERKMVLGVASEWTPRKGLNDFISLSQIMPNIQFVIVGLTDNQLKQIPDTVIGIKRTENQSELAGLYALADLFLNPTYEDNYPTTNLEALVCGTPVVTYDTGGSPEAIINEKAGSVFVKMTRDKVDINALKKEIEERLSTKKETIEKDEFKCFDMNISFEKYIQLYQKICSKEKTL